MPNKKKYPRKKPIYSFSGDEDVMSELLDYALADDRTMSHMIRKACAEKLERLKKGKKC